MQNAELTAMMLSGMLLWLLPFLLPLTMLAGRRHKLFFYLAGAFTTFLALRLGGLLWAFAAVFVLILCSPTKENIHRSFALAAPGLDHGTLAFALLPNLIVGTILAILFLRMLKRHDANRPTSA